MRIRGLSKGNKTIMDKLSNWDFMDDPKGQVKTADNAHKALYENLQSFLRALAQILMMSSLFRINYRALLK